MANKNQKDVPGYHVKKQWETGTVLQSFLALRKEDNKLVVLHFLPEVLQDNALYVKSFLQKIQATGGATHSNLVRILDAGSHQDQYYFVTECNRGPTLTERIKEDGLLDEEKTAWIGARIAAALSETWHVDNISPRTISPDHLILDPSDSSVKLFDPCLPHPSSDQLPEDVRQDILGDSHYRAPERFRDDPEIDGRTDLYELGSTLFRAVTGRFLFEGSTNDILIEQILEQSPPSPDEVRSDLSPELASAIHTLVQTDPADRYQHPKQFLTDLKRIRSNERDNEKQTGSTSSQKQRPARPRKSTGRSSSRTDAETKKRTRSYRGGSSDGSWKQYAVLGGGVVLFFALLLMFAPSDNQPSGRNAQDRNDTSQQTSTRPSDRTREQTRESDQSSKAESIMDRIHNFESSPRKARRIQQKIKKLEQEAEKQKQGKKTYLQRVKKTFQQARERGAEKFLEKFLKRLKPVEEKKDYAQAIKMLDHFPAVYMDTAAAETIRSKKETYEKKIKQKFEKQREQIATHIKNERLDKAREMLEEAERYGGNRLEEERQQLTKKLKQKRKEVQKRKRKKRKRREAARKHLNEFRSKLDDLLTRSDRSILGATGENIDELFETYREKIEVESVREKLEVHRSDVERLKTFARLVLDGTERLRDGSREIKLEGNMNGRIVGHEDKQLLITLDTQGRPKVKKPIHALPMKRRIELAFAARKNPDPEMKLAAGMTAYYGDSPFIARSYLREANENKLPRAKHYLQLAEQKVDQYKNLFSGRAEFLEANRVRLSYDFSNSSQLNDWKTYKSGNKKVRVSHRNRKQHVVVRGTGSFLLKPRFTDRVTIEAVVSSSGDPFGLFLMATKKTGYLARVDKRLLEKRNGKTVGERFYALLIRAGDPAHNIERDRTGQLVQKNKKYRMKGVVKDSMVSFHLNGKRLLSGQDRTYRDGFTGFFLLGMKYRVHQVKVTGMLHSDWLKKKLQNRK